MSAALTQGLRDMTDDDLAVLFATDENAGPAIIREMNRRDKADRERDRRAAIRAEWYDATFALYLQAEAEAPRKPRQQGRRRGRHRGRVPALERPAGCGHEVRQRGTARLLGNPRPGHRHRVRRPGCARQPQRSRRACGSHDGRGHRR